MCDILHEFPIFAPIDRVFRAISTGDGLAQWWTERSTGSPAHGSEYELWFGPGYDWRGRVTQCEPFNAFELEIVTKDTDWNGTRVGFHLEPVTGGSGAGGTQVRFHHLGWPHLNEHYRISCYCWAMYLRVLKRYLEHGETVPYAERLDV